MTKYLVMENNQNNPIGEYDSWDAAEQVAAVVESFGGVETYIVKVEKEKYEK